MDLSTIIEAETVRIMEGRYLPPETSDEVLAEAYRDVQAEAILNLIRRGILRRRTDGGVELAP